VNLSPDLKVRIFDAVRKEPAATRSDAAMQTSIVLVVAVAIAAALFALLGGVHVGPRPIEFVCGTTIGWSIVAAVASWIAFARGRSMLGRSHARLVTVAVVTPALLFAWMLLWNAFYPETRMIWPGRIGLRCLAFTLAMAAWPLVALAYIRRERDPLHPGTAGAARGVSAGAMAGVVVDLWCPIANPAHVLLGHIVPMLVLMAIGAISGRVIAGVRAR
jgi:hypothetical protein